MGLDPRVCPHGYATSVSSLQLAGNTLKQGIENIREAFRDTHAFQKERAKNSISSNILQVSAPRVHAWFSLASRLERNPIDWLSDGREYRPRFSWRRTQYLKLNWRI